MRHEAMVLFAALMATPAVARESPPPTAQAACIDGAVDPDGLTISELASSDNDLPGLRVTDTVSGGFLKVFYQPAHEAVARASAACLGGQIRLVREALGDDRRDVEWFAVVFADAGYVPLRHDEKERWLAPPPPKRAAFITQIMPHEQVHAFQGRAGANLPRWFSEGQAVWVGARIGAALNPALAAEEVEELGSALAALAGPPALQSWGGVQVKREAIRRQVSPEMQARMDADPTFMPPGPFDFGPGDITSDESNTKARYAASAKVFTYLAERHGEAAVADWAGSVSASPGRVSTASIVASAQERFGEDITPLLN